MGGNAVVLSDTAFTVLGPSGQEVFSQRHSLNQPVLKEAAGNYLLYNQGSTGLPDSLWDRGAAGRLCRAGYSGRGRGRQRALCPGHSGERRAPLT